MAPWADLLYACDHPWWVVHFPRIATEFRGELWTVSEGAREQFGLRWVMGTDNAGLCPDPDRIHTGKNSGYQALGLAHLFGVRRIVLLGYDFCVGTQGEKHWHGDHPKGLGNGGFNRYNAWVRAMEPLAVDLARAGVKVVNASRRTALKCFRRNTLENALDELRSDDGGRDAGGVPPALDREVRGRGAAAGNGGCGDQPEG